MNLDEELLEKEIKEFRKAVTMVCTLERASMIYNSKRELFADVSVKLS